VSRTALLLESRLSLSAVSVQSHWILMAFRIESELTFDNSTVLARYQVILLQYAQWV
jgi:hypothetical protein